MIIVKKIEIHGENGVYSSKDTHILFENFEKVNAFRVFLEKRERERSGNVQVFLTHIDKN